MSEEPLVPTKVIWGKCWKEEVCAPWPIKDCLELKACIRILVEKDKFYLELELLGRRIKYELAEKCYPVYTIGIATLKVCSGFTKDPAGKITAITLTVRGCIGGKIDGIDLSKCWKLYKGKIKIGYVSNLSVSFAPNTFETPSNLAALNRYDVDIVAYDADMTASEFFPEDFPESYFDLSIQ